MQLRRCYSRAGPVLRVPSWKPASGSGGREDADAPLNQVELRSSMLRMEWTRRPETVLLVKKRGQPAATEFCGRAADYIKQQYPGTRVLVEPSARHEHPALDVYEHGAHSSEVDFVVVAGGDGTMLHVSSMFQQSAPPILSFNMGSFGFLTTFHASQYRSAIESVFAGGFACTPRMRIACRVTDTQGTFAEEYHVLNDFALHRGPTSMMLRDMDCFVNDELFTTIDGDGVIIATPSGSTAYSSSCGGSMVHPSILALLLTPISPRSLSFRPMLLPKDSTVRFQWSAHGKHREAARAHFDGDRYIHHFNSEHTVTLSMSPFSLITVNATHSDWIRDINHQLQWNAGLRGTKR